MIRATHRVTPIIILSSVLIVLGVVLEPRALIPGVSLLLFVATVRGYVVLEYMATTRLKTRWEIEGGFEGRDITVNLIVENKTWIPIVTAEVSVSYSPFLRLVEGSRAALVVIPPLSAITYRIVLKSRTGKHTVGPVKVVVRDPFGLYRSEEVAVSEPVEVEIKPHAAETVVRKLFAYSRSTGLTKTREAGLGVEFYDTREYMPGDEIRRIDWKRLAFSGKLVVKEYERETYQTAIFLVDATPFTTQGPFGNTPFEHTARVVSSIARYLSKRGDLVGLVAFDHGNVVSTSKLYRGKRAYYEVVRALSKIEYTTKSYSETERAQQLEKAFKELLKLLPRERNAVFVFTSSWTEKTPVLVNFVKKLAALNCAVYVIVPVITAYEVKGVPHWARAVYRIKTIETLKKDLEFAENLRKLGVKVVAVGPEHIPQAIVNILETLARY